ncbi:mRNA-degrading endonuclease RelE, toxin component of the RelBE toxin-antitoxin system [Paenibacillus sp. yr247]|uniref:hypothetical protein n=1 Tax=Paenibacillus sp. yr247 TaxID=1761880 RepID=UPI000883F9A0|nr:hypothetical protein [Paenibacillus sp. yr247]SDP09388.1 mRNA-degrading endonuclease RelE, toxin component of the RelBE toxin-antitoxin system [Paenibacillus sp. yr247]
MFTVKFASKRVEKEMSAFNKEDRLAIERVIQELSLNPRPIHLDYGSVNRCTEVKRVKAKRVRLFYMIDEKREVVQIGKIENRDSHCYGKDPREWFRAS